MASAAFDIKMDEAISIHSFQVLRVPGGWIYTYTDYNTVTYDGQVGGQNILRSHSVFVPYSNQAKEERLERLISE